MDNFVRDVASYAQLARSGAAPDRSPSRGPLGRYAIAVWRSRVVNQPPILKTLVPHTGHLPSSAGLPFFIVTFFVSIASRFALHFTQ